MHKHKDNEYKYIRQYGNSINVQAAKAKLDQQDIKIKNYLKRQTKDDFLPSFPCKKEDTSVCCW